MSSFNKNPRKWRYTWEAQSHLPLLKLFIFSPQINPLSYCNNLNVNLNFEKSLLILNFTKKPPNLVTIFVPLPRVLIDLDNTLNFKAFDDHIQVKVPLLLPVDHPIVSSFVNELQFGDDCGGDGLLSCGFLQPLSMESDFKDLSSRGDVEFYCRNCEFKLTKRSVRCLVDLPSVNWTDVADNWFGTCCCSFGGISEKLVTKYVKSYRCEEGTCLLTTASVILCKDDIADFKPLEADLAQTNGEKVSVNNSNISKVDDGASVSVENSLLRDSSSTLGSEQLPAEAGEHIEKPSCGSQRLESNADTLSAQCTCGHDSLKSSVKDVHVDEPGALQADQKLFLNCYLGNAFIFRSDGLSRDIDWIDFTCPQCSCTLGALPCTNNSEPIDGGIRLLKCYISISPPPKLSANLFSNYTLERMFTCQLLESAKDELSFRTVVKDLKTRSSMLHIVLLNPSSWCCTGCCSEDGAEPTEKIYLHPVVKVLYSLCHGDSESGHRINQEWETKNRPDEIYMAGNAIKDLIKYVEEATCTFPDSFTSTPGLRLSSIPR